MAFTGQQHLKSGMTRNFHRGVITIILIVLLPGSYESQEVSSMLVEKNDKGLSTSFPLMNPEDKGDNIDVLFWAYTKEGKKYPTVDNPLIITIDTSNTGSDILVYVTLLTSILFPADDFESSDHYDIHNADVREICKKSTGVELLLHVGKRQFASLKIRGGVESKTLRIGDFIPLSWRDDAGRQKQQQKPVSISGRNSQIWADMEGGQMIINFYWFQGMNDWINVALPTHFISQDSMKGWTCSYKVSGPEIIPVRGQALAEGNENLVISFRAPSQQFHPVFRLTITADFREKMVDEKMKEDRIFVKWGRSGFDTMDEQDVSLFLRETYSWGSVKGELSRNGYKFEKFIVKETRGGTMFVCLVSRGGESYVAKIAQGNAFGRLRKEIEILSHLDVSKSPIETNLVKKIDSFYIRGGIAVLILKYYQHGDLFEYYLMGKRWPKDPSDFLEMVKRSARDLWNAIDWMKRKGVAHRDLRPENILIGSRGELIISDFDRAEMRVGRGSLYLSSLFYNPPSAILLRLQKRKNFIDTDMYAAMTIVALLYTRGRTQDSFFDLRDLFDEIKGKPFRREMAIMCNAAINLLYVIREFRKNVWKKKLTTGLISGYIMFIGKYRDQEKPVATEMIIKSGKTAEDVLCVMYTYLFCFFFDFVSQSVCKKDDIAQLVTRINEKWIGAKVDNFEMLIIEYFWLIHKDIFSILKSDIGSGKIVTRT